MSISNREMRLRNRNLMKQPENKEIRSERPAEELEARKRLFAQLDALYLKQEEHYELEVSERFAREEKEAWPPVWKPIKESDQYKCGMIAPFVDRWDIEDTNDSDFKSKPEYAKYAERDPGLLFKLKKYFLQARETRGYEVDWIPPPPCVPCPFFPLVDVKKAMKEDTFYREFVNKISKFAVERINARAKSHGQKYKLLDVKRLVRSPRYRRCMITFSVELISRGRAPAVTEDVQALILLRGGGHYDCVEWRFKPRGEDGPSTDREARGEDVPSTDREGPILDLPKRKRSTRLSNAAISALAAYSEPPQKKKTKTKTQTNTKTETNSAVEKKGEARAPPSPAVNCSKTIVIEHCKQCNSFKTRANQVKEALEGDVAGVNVVVNPEKPRCGSFEIREEGGEVFESLLDMKRPFQPLKALDMEKLIADIVEKIR